MAGTYQLGFVACVRAYGVQNQPIAVKVDGVLVGTWTPPSSNSTTFAPYQTAPFQVGAGNHTITLQGTINSDQTALFDNVALTLVASYVRPLSSTLRYTYGQFLEPAGLI